MKNPYMSAVRWAQKPHLRFLLLLLLALPFVGRAQTFTVTPSDPVNPQNFGSVAVGSTSPAKSYTVVGSRITMPIVVALGGTGGGTRYEISRDNITFSGTAIELQPDANGDISTTVYARFRPTAVGAANGRTLTFSSDESSDFFQYTLNGTGIAGTPTVNADPTSRNFGTQVVNTASAPQTTVVSGTSLTGPITVTAPAGFQVSTSSASGYSSSLQLTAVNGSVPQTTVYIRFLPTADQTYNGNVTVASPGATTVNVGVAGTGVLPTPVLTATPSPLQDFGQVTVGTASTAIRSFTVSGQDLQGPVTITPPAGFRIRTGTNSFSTSALTLTPTNGVLTATTVDVRFYPTVAQPYASDITVASTNAATQLVRVTGEGTPSSGNPVITLDPAAINFGTITSSGGTSTRSFEVSGTDLQSAIVLTPSISNIQIRNASAGGTFSSSPLTINPINGTVASQIIEVRLVPLVAQGNFNERIDVTSTGVTSVVTITGTNTSGAISDISVSNPNGNEFTFVTRPTTQSASQSYLLAGTNLIDPLIVQPIGPNASYFQVSSDNINFVSQLSFAPDAQGNVTQRPIYVRFVPGVNAVTVSANIRNSSAPAPDFDVSVTGISEPTIRLDRAIGAFPDNIVKGTQSNPTTVRLDGFLLAGDVTLRFPPDANDPTRNPTQIPQFEFSLDNGVTYVKTATVTPDSEGNFTRNLLVRYAPTRVGNAAQELQFSNASFFNGNFFALTSGFGRTTGFGIATEPTVQSTATIVRNGGSATITFNLSNPPAGTSYGQNRLVIASSTYKQLPTSLFPRDKQNFNPGTTVGGSYQFGSGTAIEASSNTYVVFSAASDNFTVSNLDPNLTYYFFAFEFNNDGVLNAENYRVPNNEPQNPLPVELVAFTAKLRSDNTVALNWATASETNNRGFEVERSSDAKNFKTILFKEGAGSSTTRTNYDAVDTKPLAGVSYYRLKQIDTDGAVSYSKVVVVKAAMTDVTVYPNPTQGATLVNVAVPNGSTEGLLVRITDLTGREVLETRLGSQGELNTQNLKAGTYIVIIGEGAAKVSRKLVKN